MFNLSQHNRDQQLMRSLIYYLNSFGGNVYEYGTVVEYTVTKFSDLTDKVIPFFQKYSIQGIKHQDFLDFVSALELINCKAHLTEKGINEIKKIKAGMNRGRK